MMRGFVVSVPLSSVPIQELQQQQRWINESEKFEKDKALEKVLIYIVLEGNPFYVR